MLPAPDLATIFLSNAVITGVAAGTLALIRRGNPGLKGIGYWASGQVAYSLGFVMLYVTTAVPLQPTSIPGFLFTFGGTLLTSIGFQRFLGRQGPAILPALLFFLFVTATLTVTTLLTAGVGVVLAMTVTAQIVPALVNGLLLLRHGRGAMRPAALTLAAQYGFWTLLCLIRLAHMALAGFQMPVTVWTLTPAMLVGSFILTSHALGLVWMIVGRLQEHLVHQAATDPLTGALNRRALQARLEQERARAARDGRGFAVVTFDLDHFKRLNDTHGHVVGDATLIGVATATSRLLRPTDALARLGGEEFCLLLPGVTGEAAVELAERLRRSLAALDIDSANGPVEVAASFGVAWYGAHGEDWPSLLKAADGALYRAKRNGRNRVEVADA